MPEPDLATQGIRGAISLGIRTVFFALLSFVRVAVVARFLGPRELGIFGILSIAVEAARAIASVGARSVLIQRREISPAYVGTYWLVSAVESVFMCVIVAVVAPILGDREGAARLIPLVAIVAGSQIVGAGANPGRVVAEREAQFSRIAFAESILAVFEFVSVVALAAWLRSAAALAIGVFARALLDVAISFALFRFPAHMAVSAEAGREFWRAGASLFVVSVGSYLTVYGDNLVVARVFGAEALGLYVAAYRLAEMPFRYIGDATQRVTLAVISRLQGDMSATARSVERVFELQFLCLWPVTATIALFAPVVTRIVYGPRYLHASPVLVALALLTFTRGLSNFVAPVILAMGRFDVMSRIKVLEVVAFVAAVVLGVRWGLVGVAVGAGAGYALGALARMLFAAKALSFSGTTLLRILGGGAALAAIAVLPAWALAVLRGATLGSSTLSLAIFLTLYSALVILTRGELFLAILHRARPA